MSTTIYHYCHKPKEPHNNHLIQVTTIPPTIPYNNKTTHTMKLCDSLFLVATTLAATSVTTFAFTPARHTTWRLQRSKTMGMTDTQTPEQNNEQEEDAGVVPSLENSVIPPPSIPQPKTLDPLVQSLTRMDADTARAKTVQLPLWGELILDRSLYFLLPVAAFAVIGFILSIYIAITSSDDWAIPSEPLISSPVTQDKSCRGICSQPQQDLEDLRSFMNRFAK